MLTESEYHSNRVALVSRLTGKRRAYEDAALLDADRADAIADEITTLETEIKRLDAAMRAHRRQTAHEAVGTNVRQRREALLRVDEQCAEATFLTAALTAAITQAGAVLVKLEQVESGIRAAAHPHITPRGRDLVRDFAVLAHGDVETLLAGAGLIPDEGMSTALDLVEIVTRRLATARLIIRESLGLTAADLNDDDAVPVAA